jgi:hypothetical protein
MQEAQPIDRADSSQSDSGSSVMSVESAPANQLRPGTPPTDVSSALSSPTFAAQPENTPELTRRREQSDRASSEIALRLLKGWAMLAEECPNPLCFGVPLVRPPKSGGRKDPRKVIVLVNIPEFFL